MFWCRLDVGLALLYFASVLSPLRFASALMGFILPPFCLRSVLSPSCLRSVLPPSLLRSTSALMGFILLPSWLHSGICLRFDGLYLASVLPPLRFLPPSCLHSVLSPSCLRSVLPPSYFHSVLPPSLLRSTSALMGFILLPSWLHSGICLRFDGLYLASVLPPLRFLPPSCLHSVLSPSCLRSVLPPFDKVPSCLRLRELRLGLSSMRLVSVLGTGSHLCKNRLS